jgi:hypothetical protein
MVSLMATYRLPPPACAKQPLAHALARPIMVSLMATYRLPPPACAKQPLAHALARPIMPLIMATYVCHAVRTAHALLPTNL